VAWLRQSGIVAAPPRVGQFHRGIGVFAPGNPRCTMRPIWSTPSGRIDTTGIMEGCDGALSQLWNAWPARSEILHHLRFSISG
jgi:hypothetical protein